MSGTERTFFKTLHQDKILPSLGFASKSGLGIKLSKKRNKTELKAGVKGPLSI